MSPKSCQKLTTCETAKRIQRISEEFAVSGEFLYGQEINTGHINTTYLACFRTEDGDEDRYIIQRINDYVFPEPIVVMRNVEKVTRHIRWKTLRRNKNSVGQALHLYPARGGRNYINLPEEGGIWRCYNCIIDTHTYDVVENTHQAYQAGNAFGCFQELVSDMNPEDIKESLPNFHNTPVRYANFRKSMEADVVGRAANCQFEINYLTELETQLSKLIQMQEAGILPIRITHNDTKINNVMLQADTDEAVCVIDLDTVMPGLSLYDFGDMVRTATCKAEEDEENLDLVYMHMDLFEAILRGYLDATHEFLTKEEIDLLPFSGWLITVEIGMRFLTDYLDGDKYFKTSKPEHNLIRARNQFKLATDIREHLPQMEALVAKLMTTYKA